MRTMLRDGSVSPSGKWADLAVLEPVRAVKARHASTLLVFDGVERALASLAEPGTAAAAS
jgi:NifU-like protein involved in Fe-S cluster formation